MIEFNKHHYSDLWEKQQHYIATVGASPEPYDFYIRAIGSVIAGFPRTVAEKQELIKIIMLAQADAVNNKLDVSSLKPKETKPRFKLFKRK
jgi:hypothetical protein